MRTCINGYTGFPYCSGQTSLSGLGATADDSIAVGTAASAKHTNSTAIGLNAATSRDNQQVLGSQINNYTFAGLTSGGNFQTGTTYMVTTDSSGNISYSNLPTPGINPCASASQTGTNALGCGDSASASGSGASSYGQNANASGANSVAIGNGATASVDHSVALGANSVASPVSIGTHTINGGAIAALGSLGGTVSIGSPGAERQIQNVGAGIVSATSTDAINGSQLHAVGAQANANSSSIKSLDSTLASQETQINSISANIITGGQTTATALGGGATYKESTGVSAPSYFVRGTTFNNVGSAFGAINSQLGVYDNQLHNINNALSSLGAGLVNTNQRIDGVDRKAMQGVAIAGAMAVAPMPSAPGKTRVKLNNAFYRGYAATSVSVAHRLHTNIPAAITAGASVGYRNSVMFTGGMEMEF